VSASEGPVLPRDLAGTVAYAGVDPTLEGRALQDASVGRLRHAAAIAPGSSTTRVGGATLHSPDEEVFYGRTLEEALAWCLVWLMAPEIGVGPFHA
jgi:hypothetical protein